MADSSSAPSAHPVADLSVQLMRAYLSGDGAEVERIMALLEQAPAPRAAVSSPAPRGNRLAA